MCECMCAYVLWGVCVVRKQLCDTGLLFLCHIGSRYQTQVVKLQRQPLYPVSHLVCLPRWLMPIIQNTPQVEAAVGSPGVLGQPEL